MVSSAAYHMPAISETAASYNMLNSRLLISQIGECIVFRCRLWRGGYGTHSRDEGKSFPADGCGRKDTCLMGQRGINLAVLIL